MKRKVLLIFFLVCIARANWSDYLELKNGDRISGRIISMTESLVKLKTSYGIIDVPRPEIVYGEFGDAAAVTNASDKTAAAETGSKKAKVAVPAEGLVLECLFDGYTRDSSGNNHTITRAGNIFYINGADAKANTALLSDGTGTYLEAANSPLLEGLDSFTFSCWFFIQAEAGNQYLAAKWEKTTGQAADGKFALSYSKGNLYFYIVDENGYFHGIKQEAAVTLQTWHHLAASYSKGKLKLYLDGEKPAEKEFAAKGLYKEKSPVYLMTAKSLGTEGWAYYNLSGRLDNVRLYNRELTPGEIDQLYRELSNN